MEATNQAAVAKALDSSIRHVASVEFDRLSKKAGDGRTVAREIYKALRSLDRLRKFQDEDRKPKYVDPWVPLLYLVWYQPTQVNLSYTLCRRILSDTRPFLNGDLQVVDFGCGTLAMLFGLVLAASETHREDEAHPQTFTKLIEESCDMRRIGVDVWYRFRREIRDAETYPSLGALRQVLEAVRISVQRTPPTRWLTALHVAYKENADAVKEALDLEVRKWNPDVVLITSPGDAACWTYSLDKPGYGSEEGNIEGEQLELSDGSFKLTSDFRETLYTENIHEMPDDLFDDDKDFVKRYLTQYPTTWCNSGSGSMWRTYRRG